MKPVFTISYVVLCLMSGCSTPTRTVSELSVIDQNGIARVRISALLPNPIVNGREMQRDVQVSGIQLNDAAGNEIGGFGTVEGSTVRVLALDYSSNEAVVQYVNEDGPVPSAGIVLYQKRQTGIGGGVPRARLFVAGKGVFLELLDSNGCTRIRIGVDDEDRTVVDVLGADGSQTSLLRK